MTIIFTTVHGSRLYGFAHGGSDYDAFTVTDERDRKLRQVVTGNEDRTTVGIDYFLELAFSGSHQACEALFSPVKEWGTTYGYRPMLERIRIGGGEAFAKYERTIRKFCYGDLKRRRHAIRLAHNLADLREYGRFNPRTTEAVARDWAWLAERYEGDDLAQRLNVRREEVA